MASELHDKFTDAKSVIFTDYEGLTVREISELRKQLRTASLEYRVVKNTLAKRAAEGTPLEVARETFTGPIGIAIGYDDPVALIKKVLEFVKGNEKLKIKNGIIEGRMYKLNELKAISQLPSRETILAMLIRAMQSPLSKLAAILNASVAQFAHAMEALKNKKLKVESEK